MESKGFEGTLSEKSKEALQSETWQKVRDGMKEKREVKHFTAENTAENAYGWTWDQVVKEYLKSGYNAADSSSDIVVMDKTYKTLRRQEVTVFYDSAGDTLFDVTNERLEKEYEWLMNGSTGDAKENMDIREENGTDGKSDSVVDQTEDTPEAGEAPSAKQTERDESGSTPNLTGECTELQSPRTAESKEAVAQDDMSGMAMAEDRQEVSLKEDINVNKADAAKKKYESSVKACKPHEKRYFEGPIKEYMLSRFEEDYGFCDDFLQEHKTFRKCIKYMIEKARESVPKSEMQAMVEGSIYLEWMEDYFRKDDKAEEEKKDDKAEEEKNVKKKATDKAKKVKSTAERRTVRTKRSTNKAEKAPDIQKAEVPQKSPKAKKNREEMDGQMDMFAMMGM